MPFDGANVAKFSKNAVEVEEEVPNGTVTSFIHPPNAWADGDPSARVHGEGSNKSLGWVKNVVLGGKRRELPYLLPCHDKLIHRHTDMSAKDALDRRWACWPDAPTLRAPITAPRHRPLYIPTYKLHPSTPRTRR